MQKAGTWLLKGLLRLLSWLPLRVHYVLGDLLAWLARDVVRYRRKVVDDNLALCFPDKTEQERKAVRRGFYRHFGELAAETVWFGGCRNAERLRRQRLVEIENPGEAAALYDASPGLVVMYSHCGNWELLGGIASYNYTDTPLPFTEQNFCVVYLRQSSPVWDAVLRENRLAPLADPGHFEGYIESRDIIRYALMHRDEKKIYNLITDQRPYAMARATVEVDFMGQHTQSMTGAAALARKLGLAVAYLSMRSDRRGHYLLRYTPICQDASQLDVRQIMQQYYTLLEGDIHRQPENYLWSHRRFLRRNNPQTQ
ncbi:MAG: hypothetical protein GXY24_05375 [Bacteroidales bacterium]|jgi:KDO2-lipid IV(A) lauroyltransferase|nr:hypothetical protein [Bacteroidales bacterium]